ncbi:MAG TPA: GyrI-like domain-containing protein [Bacteroidales bacterium]|nr:GyrI-like domain-containing protein [Bacteroidales bacterium]
MKILKWILIAVVIVVVLVAAVGYMLPREVVVITAEEINQPPQKVFHFVAGFVDRTTWDPWIKSDTATKCTFDIKSGYTGSKYMWEGPKIGTGTLVVDSVVFGSYILNSVSFRKGSTIPEEWTFTPSEIGTHLTWTIKMVSDSPLERLMNFMFKGMIQKTIDSGKVDLKNYLETHQVSMSSTSDIAVDEFPSIVALVYTGSGSIEQFASMLGEYYDKIIKTIEEQKLYPQGIPFAIYTNFDQATGSADVTAGMPVSAGAKNSGEVRVAKIPAFTAVMAIHTGPYEELMATYEAIQKYAADNSITLRGDAWEFYINDPAEVKDPTQLLTTVAMPVKK